LPWCDNAVLGTINSLHASVIWRV